MAIITLTLKDETLETYAKREPDHPAKALEAQLERFKDIEQTDRALLFSPEGRRALEGLFGAPIPDEKTLIEHVKRLSTFQLGKVKVTISASQAARAASNAKFFNRSVEEEIRRVAEAAKLAAFGQ